MKRNIYIKVFQIVHSNAFTLSDDVVVNGADMKMVFLKSKWKELFQKKRNHVQSKSSKYSEAIS